MKKDYLRIYYKNPNPLHVFNQCLCVLLFFSFSAFSAAMPEEEKSKRGVTFKPMAEQANCDVAVEQNGLVIIQAEAKSGSGWAKKSEGKFSFIEWTGGENFRKPSAGILNYQIKFNTPGFYRFEWRNTIKKGSDRAEHNDSWLKFPNNSGLTFFGYKGDPNDVEASLRNKKDVVFPAGTGLGKAPNGSSTEGWFKVYINNTNWAWRAVTSDHDPHQIYIQVKQAGTYTMQVGARSEGHAIDGMVLYHLKKQGNISNSKLDALLSSVKDCGGGTGGEDPDPEPEPTNTAPTIKPVGDQSATEGTTSKVVMSASDKENDAINLSVDVKDGNSKTVSPSRYSFTTTNKGKTGTFTFATKTGDAGKYKVTVTAGDGKLSSQETFTLTVVAKGEPKPPVNNENLTFYLVDTKTNKDIMALNNGSSFKVGAVGIRVEVKNAQVKSGVGFVLKGGPNNITYKNNEGNITPYSLFGDKGVNVQPWQNIKAGTYTLSAEVYGTNVKKEITFKVVTQGGDKPDQPDEPDEPTDPNEPGNDGISVTKFYLIRANTNQRITEIKQGAVVQADFPVSIEAVTEGGKTGSVRFALNGNQNFQTENVAPYALGGDTNGNFYAVSLKKGNNTVEAVPYAERKAQGAAGKALKITFSLQQGNNLVARFGNSASKKGAEAVTISELDGAQVFAIKEAYPNPLAEELTIAYAGEFEENNITLRLVNQLGVHYKLNASQYRIEGSAIKVNVESLNLSSGVYFLQVDLGASAERKTYRLIKK